MSSNVRAGTTVKLLGSKVCAVSGMSVVEFMLSSSIVVLRRLVCRGKQVRPPKVQKPSTGNSLSKSETLKMPAKDAGDVTTAKTEADCKAAGGMWDAATNTCSEKKM